MICGKYDESTVTMMRTLEWTLIDDEIQYWQQLLCCACVDSITVSLIAELHTTEEHRTARGAHWQYGKVFFLLLNRYWLILIIHSMFVQTRCDVGKGIIDTGVCVLYV